MSGSFANTRPGCGALAACGWEPPVVAVLNGNVLTCTTLKMTQMLMAEADSCMRMPAVSRHVHVGYGLKIWTKVLSLVDW